MAKIKYSGFGCKTEKEVIEKLQEAFSNGNDITFNVTCLRNDVAVTWARKGKEIEITCKIESSAKHLLEEAYLYYYVTDVLLLYRRIDREGHGSDESENVPGGISEFKFPDEYAIHSSNSTLESGKKSIENTDAAGHELYDVLSKEEWEKWLVVFKNAEQDFLQRRDPTAAATTKKVFKEATFEDMIDYTSRTLNYLCRKRNKEVKDAFARYEADIKAYKRILALQKAMEIKDGEPLDLGCIDDPEGSEEEMEYLTNIIYTGLDFDIQWKLFTSELKATWKREHGEIKATYNIDSHAHRYLVANDLDGNAGINYFFNILLRCDFEATDEILTEEDWAKWTVALKEADAKFMEDGDPTTASDSLTVPARGISDIANKALIARAEIVAKEQNERFLAAYARQQKVLDDFVAAHPELCKAVTF